jgi:zinc transport system ATP-binding protein
MNKIKAVTFENVSIELDKIEVIHNANFSIDQGEFVYLLGSNGSGKSTLIKSILNLIPIKSGNIKIFGNKPTQKIISQYFGYVPQYTYIDRKFPISVQEMIKLECHNANSCQISVDEHLEILDALKLKNKKISDLSGGEFQKILIARALVTDPEILILDEPTNNLDKATQKALIKLLGRINKELQKTIILVTHDHSIAEESEQNSILIVDGNLYQGKGKQLIHNHILI